MSIIESVIQFLTAKPDYQILWMIMGSAFLVGIAGMTASHIYGRHKVGLMVEVLVAEANNSSSSDLKRKLAVVDTVYLVAGWLTYLALLTMAVSVCLLVIHYS